MHFAVLAGELVDEFHAVAVKCLEAEHQRLHHVGMLIVAVEVARAVAEGHGEGHVASSESEGMNLALVYDSGVFEVASTAGLMENACSKPPRRCRC